MPCSLRLIPVALVLAMALLAQSVFAAEPAATTTDAAQATTTGTETGIAAVYSDRLNGHRTASGKRYRRNALTTAHKTLPFGTRVKVTNMQNHKSVDLVVTDRGPTQAGRVLDISAAAAKALGISRHGSAQVSVEVVSEATRRAK